MLSSVMPAVMGKSSLAWMGRMMRKIVAPGSDTANAAASAFKTGASPEYVWRATDRHTSATRTVASAASAEVAR